MTGLAFAVLFASSVLTAGPGAVEGRTTDWHAGEPVPGARDAGREDGPRFYVKLDGLDIGFVEFANSPYEGGQGGTLLKATFQWWRLRTGAAVLEMWGDIGDGGAGPVPLRMPVPVYVGFDIIHNREKTWFFHGSIPNIYLEAGASARLRAYEARDIFAFKAALVGDVDWYGVGLRVEGGAYLNPDHGNTWYLAAQLPLLTLSLGF